jgi:hypothetical protein
MFALPSMLTLVIAWPDGRLLGPGAPLASLGERHS